MTRFADTSRELGDRDAARVDAGLPNFWEPGTRAVALASPFAGGRSNQTPLRSPRARENDPRVHALAQGSDHAGGGAIRPPAVFLLFLLLSASLFAQDRVVRVKDLARVKNADAQYLEGVGLVVGLAGSGDSPRSLSQSMEQEWFKTRDDIKIDAKDLQNKNVAVVSVSAELPPFQAPDTYIDVHLASVGDAKSLRGGRLLITPLRGPRPYTTDAPVYAIASGALEIEGGAAGNQATAIIPKGGKVVHGVEYSIFDSPTSPTKFNLLLKRPDWNVAYRVVSRLNDLPRELGLLKEGETEERIAWSEDAGRITVLLPRAYRASAGPAQEFVARVLEHEVQLSKLEEPDAMVVINEGAGTYGVSGHVTVSEGTVQKGNIVIKIPFQKFDPAAAPNGKPQTNTKAAPTAQLTDILDNLGSVGFSPADIIDLIKTMDSMGLINGVVKSE